MSLFALISALQLLPQAHAWNDMLCERKSEVTVVDTVKSGCKSEAKIQVIAYECGNVSNNADFTRQALQNNIEKAKNKCDQFCEDQGKCSGHFEVPTQCGLSVPANKALELGQGRMDCPKTCKGRAFNYCSIYHGNFLATDKALFEKDRPNCHCKPEND